MRLLLIILTFILISCKDPYSNKYSHEIKINSKKSIFLNSTVYGMGNSHYMVILSTNKNDYIDNEKNLKLGELFDFIYSIDNDTLKIYSYKSFENKNPDLKDNVKIITLDKGIDYVNLMEKAKSGKYKNLKYYSPFGFIKNVK